MPHYRKSNRTKSITVIVRIEPSLAEDIQAQIRQHPNINNTSEFARYALEFSITRTDPEFLGLLERINRNLDRTVGMYIRNSTTEMPVPSDNNVALPYLLEEALREFITFSRLHSRPLGSID